uniref:Putative secreted protein n=1 Tax=Xenopsylla cheopis TaxID=163159 RepID=A0A6M2DZM8_XENCH
MYVPLVMRSILVFYSVSFCSLVLYSFHLCKHVVINKYLKAAVQALSRFMTMLGCHNSPKKISRNNRILIPRIKYYIASFLCN